MNSGITPDAGQTMLFTHAYPLHGIWRSKLKIIWSKLLLDFYKRLYLLDQAKLGIKRKPIDELFKFCQVMMTMAGKKNSRGGVIRNLVLSFAKT